MKKTIKTSAVYGVFQLLNGAKLGGLKKNEDKTAVLKVLRELKPVAVKFEDERKDILEKLKPEGYEDDLRRAQQYEAEMKDGTKPTVLTAKEYQEIISRSMAYNREAAKAIDEILVTDVEVEIEPLTDELIVELMTQNDWTAGQVLAVEELCTLIDN